MPKNFTHEPFIETAPPHECITDTIYDCDVCWDAYAEEKSKEMQDESTE
jgi:hypothetical protein